MTALASLLLNTLLEQLELSSEEVCSSLRLQFPEKGEISDAIQQFGYDPDHDNLDAIFKVLSREKKDLKAFAKIVLNCYIDTKNIM